MPKKQLVLSELNVESFKTEDKLRGGLQTPLHLSDITNYTLCNGVQTDCIVITVPPGC